MITTTVNDNGFAFPLKHVAFPRIGHGMLTELSPVYRNAFKAERQQKEQCVKERKQLAEELLDCLNNIW